MVRAQPSVLSSSVRMLCVRFVRVRRPRRWRPCSGCRGSLCRAWLALSGRWVGGPGGPGTRWRVAQNSRLSGSLIG